MEKQDQYNEQIEALYANMNDDERLSQLHGIYLDALFLSSE